MSIRQWIAATCCVALIPCASMAAAPAVGSGDAAGWDGLVKVSSKHFDDAYALPGADFRGYTKVMLDPTQVAFAKDWLRDMNRQPMNLMRRTTAEDGAQIVEQARAGFGRIFANAFIGAGYEVVAAPGVDVLRLSPRVIDLYINAPRNVTNALPTRVYTTDAGEATYVLEVRDSTTGALVGRVVDRRSAGDTGDYRLSITSTVSNRFNFGSLFDTWARSSVTTLGELKARSPLAAAPLQNP